MAENGELKQFAGKASGRSSIIEGANFQRGLVIVPEQILELLQDTQKGLAIPGDAQYRGIDMRSDGVDSYIQFHFHSLSSPLTFCCELKPELFFKMMKALCDGLIPNDAELNGIEMSAKWTHMLMRITSSHWPDAVQDAMPLYHLRYFAKKIELTHPSELMRETRRIRIQ